MGIQRDLMMHAAMMSMKGFPMLSSGDEIGQLNGYGYREDPVLRHDARNLHRTPFAWEDAARRGTPGTVQQRIWDGLRQLEAIRAQDPCFAPEASVTTWDTHNPHVLSLIRRAGEETLICLFNFSGAPQHVSLDAMEGICTDLITGEETFCAVKDLAPYQYALCRKRPKAE